MAYRNIVSINSDSLFTAGPAAAGITELLDLNNDTEPDDSAGCCRAGHKPSILSSSALRMLQSRHLLAPGQVRTAFHVSTEPNRQMGHPDKLNHQYREELTSSR